VTRLYNKSVETKEKGNEAYAELLSAAVVRHTSQSKTCGGWSSNSNGKALKAFGSTPRQRKMIPMKK
jgi:hypothetical protein